MAARRHLKDKEAKQLLREFIQRYPNAEQALGSGKGIEEQIIDGNIVFFVDGRPLILRTKSGLYPTLKFEELTGSLPKAVVDMGAVAHVVNGAHVMRPGIKEIRNDFAKGDLLLVVDEKFEKTIALGIADLDSASMKSVDKGKVILNVHYVGDILWKSFSQGTAS